MKADFYIGLGETARWLGSIGEGGEPARMEQYDLFNTGSSVEDYTEQSFIDAVRVIVGDAQDDDVPCSVWADRAGEWPHDHNTSADTDYTYAFNNGCIHVFEEGYMVAQHYPNGARRPSVFPSMARKHPVNPVAGS